MSHYKISLVVATYNVAPWLPAFLESLATQTADSRQIQIIFVDDGSSDESGSLLDAWAAARDESVVVVHQENAGVAQARNTGMALATGEWVTFPDPDDVLESSYLEQALKFLSHHGHKGIDMLSSHLIYLDQEGTHLNDSHPLRGKYLGGTRIAYLAAEPMIQLSAASAFFSVARIRRLGLEFDPRVRPNFEDGHFIGLYLLSSKSPKVGLLASAKYYYRRRNDNSSAIQTSYSLKSKYDDVLRFGYLDLLKRATEAGPVPRWLEYTVLYDIFWYFKNERAMHSPSAGAPPESFPDFHRLMREIVSLLSVDAIKSFDVMGVELAVRLSILLGYDRIPYTPTQARLMAVDEVRQLARYTYWFVGDLPDERFLVDGIDVAPSADTIEDLVYYGRVLLRRRHVWLPTGHLTVLTVSGRTLEASSADVRLLSESFTRTQINPMVLSQRRRVYQRFTPDRRSSLAWIRDDAVSELKQLRQRFSKQSLQQRRLSALLRSKKTRSRFENAWVFMDKPHMANDNAEHLYRHISTQHPEINCWFVLKKNTSDWSRLSAEGFHLVAHGTDEWRLLMMSATHYASSHADLPVVRPLPKQFGVQKSRFTFLQHGVINYDLSRWLNNKPFDLFVTTTPAEERSIVGPGPYSFTTKEVKRTGLPRHDALLQKRRALRPEERDLVVIMPTWRHYLLGAVDPATGERMSLSNFAQTSYAQEYGRLLSSTALLDALEAKGKTMAFMPHPNMKPYIADFHMDPRVEVLSFADSNIQDILARSCAAVTDYSSLAFEAAFLDVPLTYLHFDVSRFFDGSHIGRRGYFDYERDGFGPVASSAAEAVAELTRLAEGDFVNADEYVARSARAFPTRDTLNSARVFDAMSALTSRETEMPPAPATDELPPASEGELDG